MTEPRSEKFGKKLSFLFATCCIVDLFGVFPVIALPRAIVECGWIGMPLALIVFCIQIYTAILLGRCWVIAENLQTDIAHSNRSPYAALAQLAYGSKTSRMVNFLLGMTIFGGGIPNLLIAAQNLQLIGLKVTQYEINFSYCYWLLLIGVLLCPLMWLGSPKDMKWLAVTSVLTVFSASFLTWTSLMDVEVTKPPEIPSPTWESLAVAYGILAFQFDIHPMVLTVQMDMKDKNKLGQAISAAFLVSGGMFMVTCLLVYMRLGTSVHYNTLQGLPPSSHLYGAVLLVTLQICLSMVVGTTALFQNIEHKLSIEPTFNWRRCAVRSLLVMIAVTLAETVPRFDLIMGLIGGSMTGQLMFVFPPLIYIRLRSMMTRKKLEEYMSRPSAPLLPQEPFFPPPYESRTSYGTVSNRALVIGIPRNDPTTFEDNLSIYNSKDLLKIAQRPRGYGLPASDMQIIKRKDPSFSDRVYDMISLEKVLEQGPMSNSEKFFNGLLMVIGMFATVISSFYTLKGTIEYGEFVPPCVVNVTLASRLAGSL